ncbi:hypothetical protein COS55_01705 [Candidatus Shapirobacteria bacterium CG03_land_8_20_14_0_80_40_19]|uniref:DUF2341 domain-containing protein n=3 Tax=Candidatus Shapironibacteriota TaxID=1752721 RepID=A0A2M7BEK8_9BACT|nr:MAG: hypothetical protein COS55_01705 [Candidatus Shapirobacteria bacterium CG03_land_8_20_14_0_80_40_19]
MKKIFLCLLTAGIFNFLSTKITPSVKAQSVAWFDSSWGYRQEITIDHTKVANTDLVDFPVLISKLDSSLRNLANNGHVGQNDGGDFVFTGGDGVSKLDHEVEKYNPATGQLITWVRIPTLSPNTDTIVYLYYGNQNCPKQWNRAGVWDNNYLAVYHLSETSGKHFDSTTNGKNSTAVAVARQGADIGIIGPADEFNGKSNWINLPAIGFAGNKATLEGWAKSDVTAGSHQIVARFYQQQMIGMYSGSWATFINPGGFGAISGGKPDSGWHHIVGTYNGSLTTANLKLYRDGNQVDTSNGTGIITNDTKSWQIGAGNYWDGIIDEVRISKTPRSADWIKTEYLNQSNPAAFLTFGNEEGSQQVPTPTLIPTTTLTPTPTPTVNPVGWNYTLTIPTADHQDYGLSYPATYVFNLPAGLSETTVYKKYLISDSWSPLPQKNAGELFNGVEAARFDFPANKAYVSVAFSDQSNEIYLLFKDAPGNKIAVVFDKIALYYDNRQAAAVFTADDWMAYYSYPEFITASNEFQARGLWLTVSIVTGEHYPASWAGIQQELDEGYIEPASHSKTHPNLPYKDYDAEIGGSAADLKNNLTLPPLNRKGTSEYIYAWIEPGCAINDIVRQKLGYYKYLTDRGGWGSTAFPAWDLTNGTYGRTFINVWMDPEGTSDLSTLNSAFDQTYQAGGIYHAFFHPAAIDWSANGYALKHFDYVKGRSDVWYTGFGHLYAYHYLQERGKVSVIPTITPTITPTPTVTSTVTPTGTPAPSPTIPSTPTPTITPTPVNLVLNNSFEELTQGWANNWQRDSSSFSIDTNTNGNDGPNSLHLMPNTTSAHAFSSYINVSYGNNYVWKQYLKTVNAGGELGFYIDEYDTKGDWISGQWKDAIYSVFNGIKEISYTPTSSKVVSIGLQYYTTDSSTFDLYIDSVSFTQ